MWQDDNKNNNMTSGGQKRKMMNNLTGVGRKARAWGKAAGMWTGSDPMENVPVWFTVCVVCLVFLFWFISVTTPLDWFKPPPRHNLYLQEISKLLKRPVERTPSQIGSLDLCAGEELCSTSNSTMNVEVNIIEVWNRHSLPHITTFGSIAARDIVFSPWFLCLFVISQTIQNNFPQNLVEDETWAEREPAHLNKSRISLFFDMLVEFSEEVVSSIFTFSWTRWIFRKKTSC